MPRDDPGTERILLWRAGRLRCAAAIGRLREVLPMPEVTVIPLVPLPVRGVVNVRGMVVTVVDCRSLLAEDDRTAGRELVLVDLDQRMIGLEVDEVEDLLPAGEVVGSVRLLDLDELLRPVFED